MNQRERLRYLIDSFLKESDEYRNITATMLTKCLKELEKDRFIKRKQYNTIPPTVEYSLSERGKTLIPALESVYNWADEQMKNKS